MGLLTDSQDVLRRMLSRVHALQNWAGNTFTEEQLLERIYFDVAPDTTDDGIPLTRQQLEALRPYIVVGIDASSPLSLRRDAMGGGGGSYRPEGSLFFFLEQPAIGETEQMVDREFQSLIDNAMMTGDRSKPGLLDLTGANGGDSLEIKQLDCTGVFRMNLEDITSKGDAVRAYFNVRWGV